MSSVILEVCCGSADDVIQAHKAGAHRVELNSNLFHGGLTPTIGELVVAKRETGMKIMTMVRPREGGFCYTDAEFATAIEDARQLLSNGTDGLVFGFLHQDGTLDRERTRILAEMAQEAGKEICVPPGHRRGARLEGSPGCAHRAGDHPRAHQRTGARRLSDPPHRP